MHRVQFFNSGFTKNTALLVELESALNFLNLEATSDEQSTKLSLDHTY